MAGENSPELQSVRNLIRQRTIGAAKVFRRQECTLTLPAPTADDPDATAEVVVELMQPSVADRARLIEGAGLDADGNPKDVAKLQAHAIVTCTVIPGTEQRVFDLADVEGVIGQPTGGWADQLWASIQKILNVSTKAAKKNSSGTATASASTSSPPV